MAAILDRAGQDQRERFLRVLSAATFLIFFQAYMVAPLIPRLAAVFTVSGQTIGLIVPAYMIPYGVSTLFYGLLSDRLGRRRIMLASLVAFIVLTALTATAQSARQIILWRLVTGLGASGVVPLALALMGTLFPYEQRGRPLGWLFGAMAGGMAFDSTFGALLEPFIGWRGIFLGVSLLSVGVLGLLLPYQRLLEEAPPATTGTLRALFAAYGSLLGPGRGRRTYAYTAQRGLPLRCLHLARPLLRPPLRSGRGGHRARAPGVRCPWFSARPAHRAGRRPVGTEMADTRRPRDRCHRGRRVDIGCVLGGRCGGGDAAVARLRHDPALHTPPPAGQRRFVALVAFLYDAGKRLFERGRRQPKANPGVADLAHFIRTQAAQRGFDTFDRASFPHFPDGLDPFHPGSTGDQDTAAYDYPDALYHIITTFREASPAQHLDLLVAYAGSLPDLPEALQQARDTMEQVDECQVPVFLLAQLHEGQVHYYIDAPRDAPTMRGFAGLLHAGLHGATPAAIAATPNDLCRQLGLDKALGPLRVRGLTALLTRIKRNASELASAM